jgi:glucose/arabinose dehydrogenase
LRRASSPVPILAALIIGLLAPTSAGAIPNDTGRAQPVEVAAPTTPPVDGPAAPAALQTGQVSFAQVTSGLVAPVGITHAGDGTNRLFVVEQRGTVRVITNGRLQPGFFLDVRTVAGGISTGGERGLLGIAFHPSFETNEKLFAYYTRGDGDIIVAEFTANAARTSASVSTYDAILQVEHSTYSNHNGGQLQFGPDGYLYVFTGDGGGGGDPGENAQDRTSLLGKTLRIAPDLAGSYTVPAGNPYAGHPTYLHQIWSYGLRNPWRASFDRGAGTLWIADVGQGSQEEINREPAATGGRNYGWDCREGTAAYSDPSPGISCTGAVFTNPVTVYGHGGGNCSVTGGYVYRGAVFPDLVGHYVLADYCSGRLWTLPSGAGSPALALHEDTTANISSFGESESGEIYATDHVGSVYRVVAPPFGDIVHSPFIDDITWLYYAGITEGCGSGLYCPSGRVTRAQMASFLVRAFSLPPSATDYFTDDNTSLHEDDINALAAAGVTTGCGGTRFCPSQAVRRDEMASFMARAMDLPATATDYFTDDEASIHHEDDINRIAAAGLTTGCAPGLYCPSAPTRRDQMAAFLHRALD